MKFYKEDLSWRLTGRNFMRGCANLKERDMEALLRNIPLGDHYCSVDTILSKEELENLYQQFKKRLIEECYLGQIFEVTK